MLRWIAVLGMIAFAVPNASAEHCGWLSHLRPPTFREEAKLAMARVILIGIIAKRLLDQEVGASLSRIGDGADKDDTRHRQLRLLAERRRSKETDRTRLDGSDSNLGDEYTQAKTQHPCLLYFFFDGSSGFFAFAVSRSSSSCASSTDSLSAFRLEAT